MSIFRREPPEQLPGIWALGQDCALCGAASGTSLVCADCEAALPRVGRACERCALALPVGGVCGACRLRPPAFDDALAAFEYAFPLDRMVQRFKYAADLALGAWLARRLARRCARAARPDVLVAPPLTRRRLRERGFNQSVELARVVGRELGIVHRAFALERLRDALPQQALGARARRANLLHAFRARRRFDGAHVALVDDVMTTGATAEALARVLREAGAARVSVWSVARTPPPRT